jgi:hypothetical protein
VDVIHRQRTADNPHAKLGTNLSYDLPDPLPKVATQDPVPGFGDPYDVITILINSVLAGVINGHTLNSC